MNLLSLATLVASRIGALIYPVMNYQPIPFNTYISWMERTISALTSSTTSAGQLTRFVTQSFAGKYVLGYLNNLISDKVAYTWLGRSPSTAHLEPTKSFPVYWALVFRLRLPVTPTQGLCFPPTPAVEVQFESVFAIFVALLMCLSATSLLLLCIIRRRFNMVDLASLQEHHAMLDRDFGRSDKSPGDINMAPGVQAQDHRDSCQGNTVDPDLKALSLPRWGGPYNGSLLVSSVAWFERSETPDLSESGRLYPGKSHFLDKRRGGGQSALGSRTLKSALKTKPKPLRNVHFSKVGQVFTIPHRLDYPWERDTIVIIPRVNLLKIPGARSRGHSVHWSETVAVRYIKPRRKVVWETQPWYDAFWNDDDS